MCKAKHAFGRNQWLIVNSGAYFGIGGVLSVLGGIGEWILGKSLPHASDVLVLTSV